MKEFINDIVYADGEQWFGFIVLFFLVSMLGLFIISVSSDHLVRCYYMKTVGTSAGLSYQIKGDIDWAEDIKSFSTSNPDKALEVISNMKQCAAK